MITDDFYPAEGEHVRTEILNKLDIVIARHITSPAEEDKEDKEDTRRSPRSIS